ncbi:two-component system, sensor histidine kinase RegB [Neorhodopirellula lusitana]|uniref:histidine kinase n=1 Tax=Neorhodopirellula lusitana TaxID=445327 RepID=A0ABY1QI50_9BACT|nr:ATP-binding protein [Neorhodopirellula lusitana]SMP70236.1 two-component system, sensor histidine kinase RegB [Neorhodopirellula lusitana]
MSLISSAPLGSSTWLLRLRSFASIGQLVTIVAAHFATDGSLPVVPLCLLVFMTAGTNFIYGWWLCRFPSRLESECNGTTSQVAFGLMSLDLVTLTAMLHLSGGADNPFSFFYFVNLAVGGVMMQRGAAWTLTGLAMVGYTTLLLDSWPVRGLSVQTIDPLVWQMGNLSMRDVVSLLAFVACGTVVTYFVSRTSRSLRAREEDLRRSQSEQADAVRLEGLTTLAAGAAHELATPLSAIDIACRELSRHLESVEKPSSVDDDLALIDGQLHMCRQVLARMRSAAGDAVADQWNRITLGDLIDTTLEGIRDPHRVEVLEPDTPWIPDGSKQALSANRDASSDGNNDDTPAWESQPMWLPQEAVAQAIRNLIHNALDASELTDANGSFANSEARHASEVAGNLDASSESGSAEARGAEVSQSEGSGMNSASRNTVIANGNVTLQAQRLGNEMALYVVDRGHGMSEEVLGRAGEPFFTTKEPGRGIGLGLFLTRNVITRLGGRLNFESNPGSGTRATVILPLP